jgi:hypothetical protein
MGNQPSTKKYILIGGACALSSITLYALMKQKSAKNAQKPSQKEPKSTLKKSKLFVKNKQYELKIVEIKGLLGEIKASKETSLEKIKTLIAKVDQTTNDLINPIIIHLDRKSYLRRRKKISNLSAYITEILENLEMCESVTITHVSEILKDIGLSQEEFANLNYILMKRDSAFLNHLGAVNEKNRIMQSPVPQEYIYLKDAILFFQKKINTLKKIQKQKLFKSKINFNRSQIGIVLQNYITDLVAMETKIEEIDIIRRIDLMNNPEIRKLQVSFFEEFLRFTEQLKTNGEM